MAASLSSRPTTFRQRSQALRATDFDPSSSRTTLRGGEIYRNESNPPSSVQVRGQPTVVDHVVSINALSNSLRSGQGQSARIGEAEWFVGQASGTQSWFVSTIRSRVSWPQPRRTSSSQ